MGIVKNIFYTGMGAFFLYVALETDCIKKTKERTEDIIGKSDKIRQEMIYYSYEKLNPEKKEETVVNLVRDSDDSTRSNIFMGIDTLINYDTVSRFVKKSATRLNATDKSDLVKIIQQ